MSAGVTVTLDGTDMEERVSHVSINRGRQDELDRTGTGTCTVSLNYVDGSIADMVGLSGSVFLDNPHGGGGTVFEGFIDEVRYDLAHSQVVTRVEVDLVDALDFFAAIEIAPGTNGVVPLPGAVDAGNIFYEQEIPQDRINTAILESGFTGNTEIFTGNVQLKDTIYSPRQTLLTVIHDAADAEFPGVANVFVGNKPSPGTLTFHGRLARFNPGDSQYHIDTYTAGDGAACAGDSARALISECRLASSRARIINAALATPEGISDLDIEDQIVTDPTSISTYGLRSWSAENLLTLHDDLNDLDANEATLQFAQYYVDNYASPQIRVEGLTLRGRATYQSNSAATWTAICGMDISDILTLSVSNPGITLSEVDFFVEGVRMEINPGPPNHAIVSATYDLSPRAYWGTGF